MGVATLMGNLTGLDKAANNWTSKDAEVLQQLQKAYFYYPPVLLVLGVLGNTMSFVVFCKIAPGTSISTHFRSLAVTDTVYSVTYLLPLWVNKTFGVRVREANDLCCQILTFSNYCAGDVSMWIVVAMAVDRCVGILKPFFAKRFSSSRTALVTLTMLVFLSVAKNCTIPFAFGVSANGRCTYLSMKYYHATVRYWIALIFTGLLPVTTVFIISCTIGYTLNRHRKQQLFFNSANLARLNELRKDSDTSQVKTIVKSAARRERTAIILVFANSVTFLVTVLPTFINNALRIFLAQTTLEIMQVFTLLLSYCNHCLGFYVYCLSSAEYRRKVSLVVRHVLNVKGAHNALMSMTERNSELFTTVRRSQHRLNSDSRLVNGGTSATESSDFARIKVVTFAKDDCCEN